MDQAFTMLLTGLSGAGKSTIAVALAEKLRLAGKRVQVLDGDLVRNEIGHLFGYSREERLKVSQILRFSAKVLNRNGISVIIAAISPYQEMRDLYRRDVEHYIEVYVKCPLEVCIARDVKGLYKRALDGIEKNVIGIDEAFEIPKSPDVVVDTSILDDTATLENIWSFLENRQYV